MILYISLECSIASALIVPTITIVKVLSPSRPTCMAETSSKHWVSTTPMVQFNMATNRRFSQPLCILKRAKFTLRCYIQLQLHFMLYYKEYECKSSLRIQQTGSSSYKNCGCTALTAPRCIPSPEASLTWQLRLLTEVPHIIENYFEPFLPWYAAQTMWPNMEHPKLLVIIWS